MESKPQIPLPSELPGHRSTLDDAHHLAAEPVLDHRPPGHQRKFVRVLDQREFAARELNGLLEDALHRLAIAGGPKRRDREAASAVPARMTSRCSSVVSRLRR